MLQGIIKQVLRIFQGFLEEVLGCFKEDWGVFFYDPLSISALISWSARFFLMGVCVGKLHILLNMTTRPSFLFKDIQKLSYFRKYTSMLWKVSKSKTLCSRIWKPNHTRISIPDPLNSTRGKEGIGWLELWTQPFI